MYIDTLQTGTLNINSDPEEAEIHIDGEDTDLVTPATIPDLAPGVHTYELELEGYLDSEGIFMISPEGTTDINVTLTPSEGIVGINSTPSGARIFIDNNPLLDDQGNFIRTPAIISNLPDEEYVYRLYLPGYYDVIGKFEIEDDPVNINVTLTPKFGTLNIVSDPPGSKIFIDDIEQLGITTPIIISNILEGSHTLKLTLEGYQDKIMTFYIFADQTTNITKSLYPAVGNLFILSTPTGSKIFIDDIEQTDLTTPIMIPNISSGPHTYKLVLNGHLDKTGSFEIITGRTTEIRETMTSIVQTVALIIGGASIIGALSSITYT